MRPFKSSLFFSPAIPPRLETFAACSDHIVANDKVGLDLIRLRSVAQRLLSVISFASSGRWKGGLPTSLALGLSTSLAEPSSPPILSMYLSTSLLLDPLDLSTFRILVGASVRGPRCSCRWCITFPTSLPLDLSNSGLRVLLTYVVTNLVRHLDEFILHLDTNFSVSSFGRSVLGGNSFNVFQMAEKTVVVSPHCLRCLCL